MNTTSLIIGWIVFSFIAILIFIRSAQAGIDWDEYSHQGEVIRIKHGASLIGVSNDVIRAVIEMQRVYRKYGEVLVVTKGIADDPVHATGCCVDLRTRYFEPEQIKAILGDIKHSQEFTLEYEGDHFHLHSVPRETR